jgi:Ca2+-transporting ATPase
VTLVATDKTGTVTEHRMDVRALEVADVARALVAITLVNDADLLTGAGDPLEIGLLRYAQLQGVDVVRLRSAHVAASEARLTAPWKYARVARHPGRRATGELPQRGPRSGVRAL